MYRRLLAVMVIASFVLTNVTQLFAVGAYEALEDMLLFGEIPVVLVATKKLEKVTDVPSTIYIVDKEDILRYGLRDLKDILWMFPGMELSYQGNWMIGGHRGYTGSFNGSLLMVNGRDYTNMIAGETFISNQYGTHDMKRVELLQGPASALYGTQAMEGVINVVTRIVADKGHDFTEVTIGGGDFSTREISGSLGKSYKNGWIGFSARAFDTDGYDMSQWVGDPDFIGSPGFEQNRLNPRDPRYRIDSQKTSNNADFYFTYSDFYFGGSYLRNYVRAHQEYGDYLNNLRQDWRENKLFYGGYEKKFGDGKTVRFDIEYRKEDTQNNHPESYVSYPLGLTEGATVYKSAFWGMPDNTKLKFNLEGTYQLADHSLIGGAEYYTTESGDGRYDGNGYFLPPQQYFGGLTTAGYGDALKDKFASLYALDKWDLLATGKLLVYLGARYDKSDHAPDTVTPRAGIVWHPEDISTVKLLYGKGYRIANIFELSDQLRAGWPAEIPPREMETIELGFDREFGRFFAAALNLYQNRGQIYTQNNGLSLTGQGYVFQKADKSTKGFELATKYRILESMSGFLNYSYADPESTKYGTRDIDNLEVAPNKIQAGVYCMLTKQLGVSLFVRWIDSMETEANDPATGVPGIYKLDAYTDTNLAVFGKDIDLEGSSIKFSSGVKNLFDAEYFMNNPRGSSPAKFRSSGRELFVTASLYF